MHFVSLFLRTLKELPLFMDVSHAIQGKWKVLKLMWETVSMEAMKLLWYLTMFLFPMKEFSLMEKQNS